MTGTELAQDSVSRKAKRGLQRMLGHKRLGPWGVFFKGFVQHPVMVGSIIPSSRFTIDKMLGPVDWNRCKLFVEYGPGVGTFCQPVLDKLPRDGALIVIDTNPLYIDYLKKTITDGRFSAVLGSAADVEAIIAAHGHDGADYVLSGLPFSTLPEGVGPAIVDATHKVLRPGGAFLVYQFSAKARDFMARRFARISSGFEALNVLPCKLFWGWKDEAPVAAEAVPAKALETAAV
ncbi:class I SAM-dependent methyltransferase [Croceicoccus naphthovorans]|uniref:Methyltransferase n=1 Tax=Croceicoccus naphthovorans TaxID=1348774 RepID=A0A0G3XCV2_9SPHN|nr:methyltransferase [Croceicoccus naphthovorans]AKM09012.1 methyltransferase [Croceicoccus naphthovorans]MBB3989169.1 phospholipid N-methyltransferase [Croceicoccus naphthovorans]